MDFTFLFVIILMLLAVKSGVSYIAVGLLIILLLTSKNKYLLVAAVVGGLTVLLVGWEGASGLLGDMNIWIGLGGLFIVLLLLAKKDDDHPSQEGYSPGM